MSAPQRWYPEMPPALPDETDEQYTNRLTGADRTGRVPYDHRRNRQCSIGYHDECSDPLGIRCECPCHSESLNIASDARIVVLEATLRDLWLAVGTVHEKSALDAAAPLIAAAYGWTTTDATEYRRLFGESTPSAIRERAEWTPQDHRKDAKIVQEVMQRLAEARWEAAGHGVRGYVPVEDASNLLMALHHAGLYRPTVLDRIDVERLAKALSDDDQTPHVWSLYEEPARESFRELARKYAARYERLAETRE